jgi:DNA-binding FrmR family transcriptional regulator
LTTPARWNNIYTNTIPPRVYRSDSVACEDRAELINRLKRIEGQIRGLQRLIEEGKDCSEVVHQLAAARKALDKVGFLVLTHRMQECMEQKKEGGYDAERAMDEAMKLFLTLA